MYNLYLIIGLVAGVYAAAGLLFSRSEGGRQLIAKLVPFQAIIGIAALVVGILYLLDLIGVGMYPLRSVLWVVAAILVGLLLSSALIASLLSKVNDNADDVFIDKINKLVPAQSILGLVLAVLSALALLRI